MNTSSIPAIIIASISFYVGFYHLFIYLKRRQHRENLTFALMCLVTGLYNVFCAGLYNAASVAEGVQWQRAQFIALISLTAAFLWFVADYTHQRPRIEIYVFSVFALLVVLIQTVDRSTLTWIADRPSIKEILLPFGIEITYYEATLGPFSVFQGFMGLVASTYILWMGVGFYRRGYKREARPLLLVLGFLYAAVVNDAAVSNGLYNFVYAIEYAYLGMILLMAYSLSHTIVEAAMVKEALLESQHRFRTLAEASFEGIGVAKQGVFLDVNDQLAHMLGYQSEELLGTPVMNCVAPEHRTLVAGFIANGRQEPYEHLALRKDGTHFLVEVRARATRIGVRNVRVSSIRDITERKRAEGERERLITELETKNAELERFTYTVSHDLKSPLVTISGFLGFLEQDAIKGDMERLRGDIQRIRDATNTMQQLLNELLELSRIGRLMNPPQDAAFGELVQEALTRVSGQIAARQVQVIVTPDLPSIYGDRLRLVEVLQNLLDNGIKFLGAQEEPRIEIGVTTRDDETVFYITDNGIGIDPRYHDKIFSLFERLDPAVEGTGVGLALVKRILDVHGGRIWVESDGQGQGTTFYFILPLSAGGDHAD